MVCTVRELALQAHDWPSSRIDRLGHVRTVYYSKIVNILSTVLQCISGEDDIKDSQCRQMSSTCTTRKQRCFLDTGTARGPSATEGRLWRERLADELEFVTDKTKLEDGDVLVTGRPQIWRFVLTKQVLVVDCEYMNERVSMQLGIQHKQRPSPEPEQSPPPPSPPPRKKARVRKARVQTREYTHTLDEIRQMVADVEAELATAQQLQQDIQQHLHEASLSAATRELLQRAAIHVLDHRVSAARVVGERQDAATAAAAAPVLYVTLAGVALPTLPALVID